MAVEPRLDSWLAVLHRLDGSDLLLSAGRRPMVRVGGRIAPISDSDPVSGEVIEAIARTQLDDRYGEQVHQGREVSFTFAWRDLDRIRASVFYQRGACSLVLRRLPLQVPRPDQLGIPDTVTDLLDGRPGLIVVTGQAGSGRSTTAASLVDSLRRSERVHIVTVEDPIEYVHPPGLATISQRQVGADTESFVSALASIRRQSPDVVMVDEVRDTATAVAVLELVDSGCRVIAVTGINDSGTCIERWLAYRRGLGHDQVRLQLAANLLGVLYQRLLPGTDGGTVAACELLVAVPAVRRLIREGRVRRLREEIVNGGDAGMVTLEQSLSELVAAGAIDRQTALGVSLYPQDVQPPSGPMTSPAAPTPARA